MDCMIYALPIEFHIKTISILLDTIPKLEKKLNVHGILHSIMNRLTEYVINLKTSVLPSSVFDLLDTLH